MTVLKKLPSEDLTSLAADVARLSRLLTKEREHIPASYLENRRLRRAYISYFLPSNLRKIHLPLRELSRHPLSTLSNERLRILDIGSGPGTATLGVLEFLSGKEKETVLEFTAADQVSENLQDTEALFESYRDRYNMRASLHTVKTNLEKLEPSLMGHYDLIIFSNVLNELFHREEEKISKRIDLLDTVLRRFLAHNGSCIIIEPALRDTSRELLMVRDGLLAHGFHAYSPCLMSKSCPALVNPKDWCHENVPWDPPALIQKIDKLTGLKKDSLKFSYAVIRKDSMSLADLHDMPSFRIVSAPLISKGKIEFYLCGKGGRRLITRLDKDSSLLNEEFETLKRGTVVSFVNLLDEGKRYKVAKDTAVTAKHI